MASNRESVSTPSAHAFSNNKLSRLIQNSIRGTPFNRSSRRRFGPLGSVNSSVGSCTSRPGETPVTHRLRRSEVVNELSEQEEQNIRELRGKSWKVFRLTPLHNFQDKKSDLQHYSRNLSSYIAAEAKKGTFIDVSTPDDCTIGLFSGLHVGANDHKALSIELKGKARNGTMQVVSQAVLFSTDLEVNPLKPSLQDKFAYFACMLIRGTLVLSETIQNWLEMQFDCRVIPQTFTSFELGIMTAMFTQIVEEDKPVELVYSVPEEVEGLSSITYSTRAQDCKRLWNLIKSTDTEEFTDDEAARLMEGLESHFFECFSIRLSALTLSTINTGAAFVGRQGQIKFNTKSVENIRKVLRHLTELALEQLKPV